MICMKCSFPAGRTVWRVPKVVGVSSEDPIRILKLLKRVMMMKTCFLSSLHIWMFINYLEVVRTEPAVTKLECWSMMTFRPLVAPTLAGKPPSFIAVLSSLCFILRSRE